MDNLLILLVIGLTTGGLSGLFGVGGGFVLVPLLTLIGVPIQAAIALSLVYIIGTAFSGVIRHYQQKTIDIMLAIALSASAVVTSQLGVSITASMAAASLKLYFGLLTAAVAVYYILGPTPVEPTSLLPDLPPEATGISPAKPARPTAGFSFVQPHQKTVGGRTYLYTINFPAALVIGAGVGLVSGMFGVGGGFLLVPLMANLLKVPLKIAVGTSLCCVIAPAISASLAHWFSGQLDLQLLPALLVGGVIGVQLGARMILRVSENVLKIAFSGLLIIVSVYMLATGLNFI